MKTSTMANASSTTVSRNEAKNLTSRLTNLTSIRIIGRLDEFNESVLLLRDNLFVAHQFVKPRLAVLRNDRANESHLCAGLRIHACEIYQRRLAARHVQRLRHLRQITFSRRAQTDLPAPAIHICRQTAAFTAQLGHVHFSFCTVGSGDGKFSQKKLRRW